jgi:hypothetical protein
MGRVRGPGRAADDACPPTRRIDPHSAIAGRRMERRMSRAPGNSRRRVLNGHSPWRAPNGHRTGSSEAENYWQYSQECIRQAVEADTSELRDQLLDLARLWIQAALCEESNSKTLRTQQVGA